MDPLFHTRDEGIVKTMDFTGWISSEEGEDRKVGRKDGHSFLGRTRYNSYRLPSVEANDQWRLLRPFQQHFKEKTSPFGEEESALPSRQCTDLYVPGTDGQIQRIPLRIASPSNIFAIISCFQIWRNGSKERDSQSESSSSKQRLILKSWNKSYYSDGLKKLENRWNIELKGDYVKK